MKPYNIKGRGRHYPHPELGKTKPLTSVTNILGCWPKQRLLVPWSAKMQKELDVEAAYELVQKYNGDFVDAEHFKKTLDEYIGKRRKHRDEFKKAGDIGGAVHKTIEWRIKTQLGIPCEDPPTLDGPALWAYQSFETLWSECEILPIESEIFCYSDMDSYAGTADFLCELTLSKALLSRVKGTVLKHFLPESEGKNVKSLIGKHVVALCDFKTGKAIYPDQRPQLAAYINALDEQDHPEIDSRTWGIIFRLPKVEDDPEFEVGLMPPEDREKYLEAFLAAKTIWKIEHGE